jgi:LuxR family maltose regulon positive regulatory protein
MGKKSSANMPTVKGATLYTNDEFNGISLSNQREWYGYLIDCKAFYFEGHTIGFSMRQEKMRNGYFWYSYRRIDGKLKKLYVGLPEIITIAKLREIESRYLDIKETPSAPSTRGQNVG